MLRLAASLLLATVLLAPTVAAATDGFGYDTTVSKVGSAVESLYTNVLWVALIIGVIVEALLIFVVFKFRKNRTVPRGEVERGHTTAEIAWTAVPGVILVWIGVLSLQTMDMTDLNPPTPEVTVDVTAAQFLWSYQYKTGPDAGKDSIDIMRVPVNKVVRVELKSKDVAHAFFVREFAVKLDAYPSHTTYTWFKADKTGNYTLQCAELCGEGHGLMRGTICVYPQGVNGEQWCKKPITGQDVTKDPGPGPHFNVSLLETAGSFGAWSISPETITVTQDDNVHIRLWNNGTGQHNFTIGGAYNLYSVGVLSSGESGGLKGSFNFTAVHAGTFEYWCAVQGHKGLGMRGTLVVNPKP